MPIMIDKHDAKEQKLALQFVAENYEVTKLDGNFQRYGGFDTGSGWNLKDGLSYLQCLITGTTYNDIINIDVEAALRHAEDEECEDSIEYYSSVLKEGYEYVSVDGNNTASFVAAFLSSQERLKISIEGSKKKKLFSELNQKDQKRVQFVEAINVITLRKILIEEACDLFRNLNKQTSLNNQEHRQARWSGLSKYIRDFSNGTNRKIFLNFIYNDEKNLDTRSHEEMVALFALKCQKTTPDKTKLSKTFLDALYEDNDNLKAHTKQRVKSVLCEVLKMAEQVNEGNPLKHKLKKGQLHALFDFVDMIIGGKNLVIKDSEALFEWFLGADISFLNKAKSVTEEQQEELSYSYWTRFYNLPMYYKNILSMFEAKLLEEMDNLYASGIIKPKRTSADTFTWEQKLQLFDEQKGILRTGAKMNILDMYLGKYEADHRVPVNEGGQTTIENGELMTVAQNRQKGSQTNEQHFDFQR